MTLISLLTQFGLFCSKLNKWEDNTNRFFLFFLVSRVTAQIEVSKVVWKNSKDYWPWLWSIFRVCLPRFLKQAMLPWRCLIYFPLVGDRQNGFGLYDAGKQATVVHIRWQWYWLYIEPQAGYNFMKTGKITLMVLQRCRGGIGTGYLFSLQEYNLTWDWFESVIYKGGSLQFSCIGDYPYNSSPKKKRWTTPASLVSPQLK